MKIRCTTHNGLYTMETEVSDQKAAVEEIAAFQEVFGEEACGKCGCKNLHFAVREVDGNTFYEMRCQKKGCGAKLAYGAHKTGKTLFPKRRDDEGNWRGSSGWVKWNPDKQVEE